MLNAALCVSESQVDAAARVLDPMFAPLIALAEGKAFDPPVGQFLKDYKATEW